MNIQAHPWIAGLLVRLTCVRKHYKYHSTKWLVINDNCLH